MIRREEPGAYHRKLQDREQAVRAGLVRREHRHDTRIHTDDGAAEIKRLIKALAVAVEIIHWDAPNFPRYCTYAD
jgi:hypothetical protein